MTAGGDSWWAAPRGRHHRGARAPVVAARGMVATSNPLATATGVGVLAAGGSALDAAIAADAVLGVTDPHLTGVGGDCAAIVHDGRGAPVGLISTGGAPARATIDELRRRGQTTMPAEGPLAVTVPGAVAGWSALHRRFGRLPLARLLAPAIEYAADGVPLAPATSLMWSRQAGKLERHPALAASVFVNGKIPGPATRRRAPALAETLRAIAEGGAEAFYRGPLAARVGAAVEAGGGLLDAEDLARFSPVWVDPLATTFGGYTVHELPPNTQGLIVLLALNILTSLGIEEMEWGSADYGHAIVEAVKISLAIRDRLLGDPEAMTVTPARLLDAGTARELAGTIDPKRAGPARPDPATLPGGTSYLAAADADGMMVSFISSVFAHFGSGFVAGDTGVLLQNRGASFRLEPGHPQSLAPGRRPLHTIIPALAERPGELRLCFGVTGADVQPQGHLQTFLGVAQFGMSVQEAIDAPRLRVDQDGTVAVEPGMAAQTRAAMEARGHRVRVDDPLGFGAGQMVLRDLRAGVYAGGAETRRDGAVSGR